MSGLEIDTGPFSHKCAVLHCDSIEINVSKMNE